MAGLGERRLIAGLTGAGDFESATRSSWAVSFPMNRDSSAGSTKYSPGPMCRRSSPGHRRRRVRDDMKPVLPPSYGWRATIEAARAIVRFAQLQQSVTALFVELARGIQPAPASLVIFGSFARGDAGVASDLDVLAVRADRVNADDSHWIDSLGEWEIVSRSRSGRATSAAVARRGTRD